MNILRVILGLLIGWVILMVLFLIGLCQIGWNYLRRFFAKTGVMNSGNGNALDMVRCPTCGVYTSGLCNNPACANSRT